MCGNARKELEIESVKRVAARENSKAISESEKKNYSRRNSCYIYLRLGCPFKGIFLNENSKHDFGRYKASDHTG
jgi:hypothetical protein